MRVAIQCGGCGKSVTTTARYAEATGGLCPNCFGKRGVQLAVCENCSAAFSWSKTYFNQLRLPSAPKRCPRCIDTAHVERGRLAAAVQSREVVMALPAVLVEMEMEAAPEFTPPGSERGCRRLVMIDREGGKSYTGKVLVYDYRPDGTRGANSLAAVRVMRSVHDERTITRSCGEVMGQKYEEELRFNEPHLYLVLERPTTEAKPVARLTVGYYHGKHNASGGVERNESLHSWHLTSRSRSGCHWGGTVVALVDDENPLLIRQDHRVFRHSLSGVELDEAGYRAPSGEVSLAAFVPREDFELLETVKASGFSGKVITGATLVRPRELDGLLTLPEGLPDDVELRLEAVEAGGGFSSTGHAVIVCGPNGERLRPYATAGDRGDLACGTHAWFGNTDQIVTVHAGWCASCDQQFSVKVQRHFAEQDGISVKLSSETLYSGVPINAPQQFAEAVKAAVSKSSDYHCRTTYFA